VTAGGDGLAFQAKDLVKHFGPVEDRTGWA
jgi:hypothetical protein